MDSLGEIWNYDQDFHTVARYLGLSATKAQDHRIADKVFFIIKNLKGRDMVAKRVELEKVRRSLGTNQIGELLIDQLYQTMRLRRDVKTQEVIEAKEQRVHAEEKAMKEVEKLEKQVAQEKEHNEILRSIQQEKSERMRLETEWKEQTGKDFEYATT